MVAEKVFVVCGQSESRPTTKLSACAAIWVRPEMRMTAKAKRLQVADCRLKVFPACVTPKILELFLPIKPLKVRPEVARLLWHCTTCIGLLVRLA